MDRVKLSMLFGVMIIVGWALSATNTYADPFIEVGPLSITLPWILLMGGLVMLVQVNINIMEKLISFMTNGTVMTIIFAIIIILGILALIDLILGGLFGWDLGIIDWFSSL